MTAVAVVFTMNTAYSQIGGNQLIGKEGKVITTTVPFLTITPDSRSGAMGDAGVATPADANSLHWNAAKLAWLDHDKMGALSYTPWLRTLVPDINLAYLSYAQKINNLSGFSFAMRYFSLGDIIFTNDFGQQLKVVRPYELSLDGGYAQKLSSKFSIGIVGRFIYSNLAGRTTTASNQTTRPAFTGAGDISGYYKTPLKITDKNAILGLGFNISNLGGKISYTSNLDRDFIPANLRLGSYLNLDIDEFNQIGFALDFNKLLVPSQPIYALDSNGFLLRDPTGRPIIERGKSPDQSTLAGAINSFTDAPNGFSEEIREINPSFGIEYWYNKQFAVRGGYFYEAPSKGNRQYATFGIGIKYNILGIDLSYIVPTNSAKTLTRSPLANTLRFTLSFALDNEKKAKTPPNAPAPLPEN